jgi:hypothetical protein
VVGRAANLFGLFDDDSGSVPSIEDETFAKEASARCATARTDLPSGDLLGSDDPPTRAAALNQRAEVLERLTLELRALPADTRSVGSLDWWFENLETVVATDRRTAEALAAGETRAAVALGDDGDIAAENVRAFARENGITACAF